MMKTEWKLIDDDDEKVHLNIFSLTGNEEQGWVMKT